MYTQRILLPYCANKPEMNHYQRNIRKTDLLMIIYKRHSVSGSYLHYGVVQNLAEIILRSGFASIVEVVV